MNQTDKRTKVQSLLQGLSDDLSTNTLSDAERYAALEQLKVHGRDPTGADALYCESGLTVLSKYAFGSYSDRVLHEACRVIANALLLQPSLQVVLIELDGLVKTTSLYLRDDVDSEFLGARILFFCTYAKDADFTAALSAGLLQGIENHLARHAAQSADNALPMDIMAVTETAKLIFNLQNKYPDECKILNVTIPDLCAVLVSSRDAAPPLGPPIGPILNALACLDFGAVPAQSMDGVTTSQISGLLNKLVDILDRTINHYKPLELDTLAISLMTVLRMLYDTSSSGVQADMKHKLLPADSERELPLGQSQSLASKLLRMTTSPGLSNLPEAISSLLFEMSDKDATKFVKNIGYGYAAGYLAMHKIPFPESLGNPTTVDTANDTIPINPVTGQRLDREPEPDLPEMTEEEKEQEAERLFVLFERLRATGVVNAENPVRQAMEKGDLDKVPDSDPD